MPTGVYERGQEFREFRSNNMHPNFTNKRHGMYGTPTYRTWQSMKARCLNPKSDNFKWYGGRGISICQRWMSFSNFFDDMSIRPNGCTLDRIKNDGNYSPDNCKWSTVTEQRNNKSDSILITLDGKSMSIDEWSLFIGINRGTLSSRYKRGWSHKRILTCPIFNRGQSNNLKQDKHEKDPTQNP